MSTRIPVLTKQLRDGSPLTIHLIPEGVIGWWLEVRRSDELMGKVKNTPRPLPEPPQPELTHGLRVGSKTIGLTASEAEQVDDAIGTYKREVKARLDAEQAERMARIHAAAPGARTWVIQGGDPYAAGQTFRLDSGDCVTVLKVDGRYIAEDGMSFGLGEESGYLYRATVRMATDEEAAPILEAEQRQQRREELRAEAGHAFGWLYARGEPRPTDAERPERVDYVDLPKVRVDRLEQLYVDEAAGVVYSATSNGADGDNWALNNASGAVVYRQPLTPERGRIIQGLRDVAAAVAAEDH